MILITAYHCPVRLRPVPIVLFNLVIMKHYDLVPCIYIFLNDHSIIKTDNSVFKDPSSPQESFRTFESYKVSHTYAQA